MSITVFADGVICEPEDMPNTVAENNRTTVVLNDETLIEKADQFVETNDEIACYAGLTISNRKLVGQRYYSDEPFLVDSINGPLATGPTLTFETEKKAGFSGECGVTKSMITAKYGVDFSESIAVKRTFQFNSIPANKVLTYKCYVNYNVYEFDVYRGDSKIGTSKYWVPVGIVVVHNTK